MRPFPTAARFGTPRRRLGYRAARAPSGLLLALAAAASTVAAQSAQAGVDQNWAGPAITQILSERSQEAERSGRAADDTAARPRRRAQQKHKRAGRQRNGRQVASLARDIAPAPLRPLSVVEWARPKLEAVLLPKAVVAPPKTLGPMVA